MVMTLVILALCIALPVLGVAHIAEQRRRGRAEREAIESERRFRQLAESSFDMIVRFDPRTQEWVELPLPEAESDPRRIDIDPTNPNRVFFSGNTPGRMGFVEVLP